MLGQSNFSRSLIAVVAAVMMSSMTVGAAVGPAGANPFTSAVQNNLNA